MFKIYGSVRLNVLTPHFSPYYAVTRKDAFPVPHVKDALDSLRGARYFATIDLLSGYWQIPLTHEARARFAFCTRLGLFKFTRMPLGLSNAPASFCRLMQLVFKDMLHKCCFVYLDDIIDICVDPKRTDRAFRWCLY